MDEQLCPHTQHVLAWLRDSKPDFRDALRHARDDAIASFAGPAPVGPYGLEELVFRVPVLVEGGHGVSPIQAVRAFVRDGGLARVEVRIREGIGASDLLGLLVPTADGGLVWQDGPLSAAFRRARVEKTVLIIDEILRLPRQELSALLTALSPDQGGDSDQSVYRLPTGRIVRSVDGIGEAEVLEAPVRNLGVVATTTDVGSSDAAAAMMAVLAERFIVIRQDSGPDVLAQTLAGQLEAKGFRATRPASRCASRSTIARRCSCAFSRRRGSGQGLPEGLTGSPVKRGRRSRTRAQPRAAHLRDPLRNYRRHRLRSRLDPPGRRG